MSAPTPNCSNDHRQNHPHPSQSPTRGAPGKTRTCFTSLIAELDASEEAVTEAVNDTPKAIAASLLMEQVLAPRPDFAPQAPAPSPDGSPIRESAGFRVRETNCGEF